MDKDLVGYLKEISGLVALVVSWGAILVGGSCLLLYTEEIEQFPSGIGLGEGLAFYLICAAFFLTYAIYWAGITSLGAVLLRWPAQWLVGLRRNRSAKKGRVDLIPHAVPFHLMTGFETCLTAVVGAVLVLLVALRGGGTWCWLLAVAVIQGTIIAVWLVLRRQDDFVSAGLINPGHGRPRAGAGRKDRRFAVFVIPGLLVVTPLLIMPSRMDFVNAAFSTAQLRKDNATIHVRGKWNGVFAQAGMIPLSSVLGDEYKRYVGVRVLLRSIGDTTVVQLPATEVVRGSTVPGRRAAAQRGGKPRTVSLPSTDIWVE